ncbi:putative sugar phosphate/phosphate translocator [Vitis vinifera]|uniref:Putative sugar phosphate/phosphate translocator n=1 Tax=Vitis vinifera TaxID=29760 RepID=A0A438JAE5_VITVI|nr:putative sugar phosphate/phosphate translocator [Vitis vinifera]
MLSPFAVRLLLMIERVVKQGDGQGCPILLRQVATSNYRTSLITNILTGRLPNMGVESVSGYLVDGTHAPCCRRDSAYSLTRPPRNSCSSSPIHSASVLIPKTLEKKKINQAHEGVEPVVHDRPRHLLVLLQHWGFAPQQVLAQQLWLQVPYLPHHVSHDGLFASQLYCYCLDEDGSFADHTVSSTVLENFLSQSCFLLVGGLWNVSLRYLPVSFNQAVGATTPFFTAVFAYLMKEKREDWITYLTLIPVVTGVIIASGVRFSFSTLSFNFN